jgi:hypothetical protein
LEKNSKKNAFFEEMEEKEKDQAKDGLPKNLPWQDGREGRNAAAAVAQPICRRSSFTHAPLGRIPPSRT